MQRAVASVTAKQEEIKKEEQVDGCGNGTKVLVFGVRWRVASNALLHTLGRVLDALAGGACPVDVVLAGSDGVGSAACQENQAESG